MAGLFDDLVPSAGADDLFGDLVPTTPRRELPAGITPSEGRSATPMGRPDPRLEARRGTMRSVRPYVAGGPGLPDEAAATPAAAPTPTPAAPAQFRDQREAVDDAVDRIAMGARPDEVFTAFERIGVPRQAIIARGEELGTKGFMPDLRPVTVRDGVASGGAPQSIANVEPTAGQAVANFGRRVAARGSQAMTGALASMGAIGPDDATRLLARDEKKAQAAAVGTELQRELEALGQVKEWGEIPGALVRNPSGVAVMLAESVALSVPALATAFMGLPRVAMAAGVGFSSGSLEYGSAMSEALADRGVSLLDVDRVSALLKDEKFIADVRERGAKRGLAVGVVDALTAGIAGKFVEPALAAVRAGNIAGREAVRQVAARSLAEVGVQAAGGAGGEALAQKLTGENKPLDIVMEALAEGFSAPFEVRSNLKASGALAAAAAPDSQIARAIDDQVSRTYFRQDAIDGYVARAGDSRFYDPTFVDPQQTVAQPAGGRPADAAAGPPGSQGGEPPVPNGMVRLYHGGLDKAQDAPTWFTRDRRYAAGYAAKSGGGLLYVDVPENDPSLKWPEDGREPGMIPPANIELPADISARAMPVPGYTPRRPDSPRVEDMPTTPFTPEQTAAMAAQKRQREAAAQAADQSVDPTQPQPKGPANEERQGQEGRRQEGLLTTGATPASIGVQSLQRGALAADAETRLRENAQANAATAAQAQTPLAAGRTDAGAFAANMLGRINRVRADAGAVAGTGGTASSSAQATVRKMEGLAQHWSAIQSAPDSEEARAFRAAVQPFEELFGYEVVPFVDDGKLKIDGFANSGKVWVNLSNPARSIGFTVLHEVQHLVRKEAESGNEQARLATQMLDQVWGMIEPDAKRAYAEKYLFRQDIAAGQMTVDQALADPKLRDEMLSDFMGKRADDREFWQKLAAEQPSGFKAFVDKWLGLLDQLITKLRGERQSGGVKDVDLAIRNLERAKRVAEQVVADWAAMGRQKRQDGTGFTAEDVAMSPKPAPVYTHEVIDPRDGNKVVGRYQSAAAARKGRDRLDQQYGAYRYRVREIASSDVKLSAPEVGSPRGVSVEVAPNPDQPAAEEWRQLDQGQRRAASEDVMGYVWPMLMQELGWPKATYSLGSGTFEGEVNPSFTVEMPGATFADIDEMARIFGYVLDQKAMVAFDEADTTEGSQAGFIKVIPPRTMSPEQVDLLRAHIAREVPQANGDTVRNGAIVYGNFSKWSDAPIDDRQFFEAIRDAAARMPGADQIQGDLVVEEPVSFRSEYIEPGSRDGYLEGTRYASGDQESSGGVDGVRGRARGNLDRLRQIAQRAVQRREDAVRRAAQRPAAGRPDAAGGQGPGAGAGQEVRDQPRLSYGRPRAGATSVAGYHFSREDRSVLVSSMYGTGLAGAEAERLAGADQRVRSRVYFYVDRGTGINPESGVGGRAHRVQLTNLYDADEDALRLGRGGSASDFELAVLEAGFDGYFLRDAGPSGVAVLIGQHAVPVEQMGGRTKFRTASPVSAAKPRQLSPAERIGASRALPSGQLSGRRWASIVRAVLPAEFAELAESTAWQSDDVMYKDELARQLASDDVQYSRRDDEMGGFSPFQSEVDQKPDDVKELSDKELDDLNAELAEVMGYEQAGGQVVARMAAPSDSTLKSAGIMAEAAYRDLEYQPYTEGTQEATIAFEGGRELTFYLTQRLDRDFRGEVDDEIRRLGSGAPLSMGTGVSRGVTEGFARAWNRRVAASVDLMSRGFDLATAIPPAARSRVIAAWKKLPTLRGAFEFGPASVDATARTSTDKLQQLADSILGGTRYEATASTGDEQGWFMLRLRDAKTGASGSAQIQYVGGANRRLVMHTQDLEAGSSLGKPFYQVAFAFGQAIGVPANADPMGLTGINGYRRTEQMISAAARAGEPGAVNPGVAQRIYGWRAGAKTAADKDKNLSRLVLSAARNAAEVIPQARDLTYDLEDGTFGWRRGAQQDQDAEAFVRDALRGKDARAAGVSRSTLARAAVTFQAIDGTLDLDIAGLADPILYSSRDDVMFPVEYAGVDRQADAAYVRQAPAATGRAADIEAADQRVAALRRLLTCVTRS